MVTRARGAFCVDLTHSVGWSTGLRTDFDEGVGCGQEANLMRGIDCRPIASMPVIRYRSGSVVCTSILHETT